MDMFVEVSCMQYVMLILGTLFGAIWIALYIKFNNSFDDVLSPLKKNEYFLSEIFFIGFGLIEALKLKLNGALSQNTIRKLSAVKGRLYAGYYYYVTIGGKITYVITFLPISFFITAIVNDIYVLFVAILAILLLVFYLDFEINNLLSTKQDNILIEFPQVLSNLCILLNASMTIRDAWKSIANSKNGELYDEMKKSIQAIENGTGEIEAYKEFGENCGIMEVKKFVSLLIQNIQKGSYETASYIKDIALENWEIKKQSIKIKGELASQRLMLPIGMMLIAILMIIVVPIFSSF